MKFAKVPGLIILSGVLCAAYLRGNAAAARTYTLKSLRGAYAGRFSGTIFTNNGTLLMGGTGVFVADGKGNITGHESYNLSGTPCNATVTGTYAVNPDGTGTLSAAFNTTDQGCESGTYTQSLAIGDSGRIVMLANSNPGQVIDEQWQLQRPGQ